MKKIRLLAVVLSAIGLTANAQQYFDDAEGNGFPILNYRDSKTMLSGSANVGATNASAKFGLINYFFERKGHYVTPANNQVIQNVGDYEFEDFRGQKYQPVETPHILTGKITGNWNSQFFLGTTAKGKLVDGLGKLFADGKITPGTDLNLFFGLKFNSFKLDSDKTNIKIPVLTDVPPCNYKIAPCDIPKPCKDSIDCDPVEAVYYFDSICGTPLKCKMKFTPSTVTLAYLNGGYSYANYRVYKPDTAFNAQLQALGWHGWTVSLNVFSARYTPSGIYAGGVTLTGKWNNNYNDLTQYEITTYVDTVYNDTIRKIQQFDNNGYKYAAGTINSYGSFEALGFFSITPRFLDSRAAVVLYTKVRKNWVESKPKAEFDLGFQIQFLDKKNPFASIVGIYFEWKNIGKLNINEESKAKTRVFTIGINTSLNIFNFRKSG